MTQTEHETLELLAKGYVEDLALENIMLATRGALEEIYGINIDSDEIKLESIS